MVDGFGFDGAAQAKAHLGGGGFGERDDEQFVERRLIAAQAIQATGDECFGLAGTGTGHDEDVAARGDRLPLGRRERIVWVAGRFHACENFNHRLA